MVKPPLASRGEVWLARLDPAVGDEIQKTRPCLVVSPDGMNRHLGTVTVLPLTSGSQPAHFRLPVEFLGKSGLLLGDQIRSISRLRLVRKAGALNDADLSDALRVMREMFEE